MTRRRLPIGIQTFRKIREGDFYYVDKTAFAQQLIEEGTHYFLSRPRRFGKSLFLDTLKELFEANEPLFRGLAVHPDWDWSKRCPVVRLSFGSGDFGDPDAVRATVAAQLARAERRSGVPSSPDLLAADRFAELIELLAERVGERVVVLVDEYDKPILDALGDPERARRNRDFLRGLYSVVKDADAYVRFSFFTGVSRFSKVSLFSGLNNLKDLTLHPRYAAVCGYTEADLDEVFAPELADLDRDRIREWYNGYHWLGAERMYNPFDILLLFDTGRFTSHWFETGSPSFLVETLTRRGMGPLDLETMIGEEALLSRFDVDDIGIEALLFQTGYLTIAEEVEAGDKTLFRLGYPNREVRQSLSAELLRVLGPDPSRQGARELRLRALLAADDFAGMEELFRGVFEAIPYEWHTKSPVARYEGYYASVVYAFFASLGLDIRVEESGRRGRVDLAVLAPGRVLLFEFKVVEEGPTGAALAQLRAKGYAEKYRSRGEPIHLIGVEFSRKTRNLAAFEVERA